MLQLTHQIIKGFKFTWKTTTKYQKKTMWSFGISATLKVMSEKIWANVDQFAIQFGFNRRLAKNENNFEMKALWTKFSIFG